MIEDYNTKIRPWLGIIAIIFIGFLMIKQPDAFDEQTDISGRKRFLKLIFSYIWGIPAGVLLLALGIFLGYNKVKGTSSDNQE